MVVISGAGKVCKLCPICLHARYHQKGIVFDFVKNVEQDICHSAKPMNAFTARKLTKGKRMLPSNDGWNF